MLATQPELPPAQLQAFGSLFFFCCQADFSAKVSSVGRQLGATVGRSELAENHREKPGNYVSAGKTRVRLKEGVSGNHLGQVEQKKNNQSNSRSPKTCDMTK